MVEVKLFEINLPDKELIKDKKSLEGVIGYGSVSFSVENVSRLLTHHICEATKASFTQQSQRYVEMDDHFIVPQELEGKLREEYIETTKFLFNTYKELSKRKEEFKDKKGRPKKEWYEYGILPEDARYILPLSTKSNIFITMPFHL